MFHPLFLQSNSPNILGFLQQIWENIKDYIPNVLGALAIAIIGWIVARILSRIIYRLLKRIKVDRLFESLNDIDFISSANIKIEISKVLSKTLYYIVLLVALIAAVETLGMKAVSDLIVDLLGYLPKLFSALVVFIVGLLIANFIKNIIATAATSLGIPSAKLIANFIFYFLFLNVLMIALDQAEIKTEFLTSNLTLILGGVVLAFAFGYGFASKDLMSNYIASFYTRDKFHIGDTIKVENLEGTILDKDNSSITLVKENGQKLVVPLSILTKHHVEILREESVEPDFSDEENME